MMDPNVAQVMDNIAAACRRAGRDPGGVKLLAVTKQVPVETVRRAVELGLKLIGENRVQEARSKAAQGAYAGAALCMIGHLQSNKASLAARVFDQVHAIDSERIGAVLSKFRLLYNPGDPMPVLLEVNAGRDPARFGVMPEGAADLAQRVLAMRGLILKGLMAVAPGYGDERLTRTAFRQLRELRDGLARQGTPEKNLEELSMGMSGDYQIAVEEGSTMVRIGTALFGPRR